MDVFLDMTGTITDMESEDGAFLEMCKAIGRKFKISMDAKEIMKRIIDYRKPYMDERHKQYSPIRHLIVKAVENIENVKLRGGDVFWIMDVYSYYHAKYVKFSDGAEKALKELRKMSKHMGLITDADTPYTLKVLKSLGIKELFDSITTAEDVGVGKPNPKIFEAALKNSKSDIRIYIGDSEFRDIKGAKNVGMITIKIGDNNTEADYVANNLPEAVEIIKNFIQ